MVGIIRRRAVDSFEGRTGTVVAVSGDYSASQITNDSTVTGANVDDALETLAADIPTTEEIQDLVGAMVSGNTETNITVTYQDGDGTIDFVVADASTSAKGVVELATTAEAQTGTDTARAVTPAGLKAVVEAGTYTPTGYAVTNIDSVTPGQAIYQRNGNVVTVSGYVELNMTAAGGAYTRADLSLPIASNFVNSLDLSGVATDLTGKVCAIQANGTNDRAQIESNATVTTTVPYRYVYQYVIK